jgi:hypothetical protein
MRQPSFHIILLPAFSLLFAGCVMSKKTTDDIHTSFVRNNTALVQEAVQFAITATYNNNDKTFLAEDIHNKAMRRKISSLGRRVDVNYRNDYYDIPDSNVTFSSMTIFGVTEIIYDFAARERHFEEKTGNRKEYYFIKLADRIYYRRRPIPMM